MFNAAAILNETVGLSCNDSISYRNPINNFTCVEHKSQCKAWGQILSLDQFDELVVRCPVACNSCLNSSLPTISSFVKDNGNISNALRSTQLTTVAILSTFCFVATIAAFVGLFVIRKRSLSAGNDKFPLPLRQGKVLFREFHSEDASGSEQSVCASSDVASSKSSSEPASDLGVVMEIDSTSSSDTSCIIYQTAVAQNSIEKHSILPGDIVSPINGFDIPASPTPNQILDVKCFTYTKAQSSSTISPKEAKDDKPKSVTTQVDEKLSKSVSSDSCEGATPKTIHLLGYAKSTSSDGLEYDV